MRTEERGWEDYYRKAPDDAWSDGPEAAVLRLTRELLWPLPGLRVLDLCCGDGRNLFPWAGRVASLVGIDASPTGARRAAQRFPTAVILVGDAADTRLPDGSVDVVTCVEGIPHVPAAEVFAEVARVLRPGGAFLFNVFTPRDVSAGDGVPGPGGPRERVSADGGTVHRLYEAGDVRTILPSDLVVEDERAETWWHEPHGDFRPYRHLHDGIWFRCRKRFPPPVAVGDVEGRVGGP